MWLISQYTFFSRSFFPSHFSFTITFSFSIFLYLIMDIQEFSPSIPVECYNEPLNNFYHEELSPLIPVERYNESLNNENMDTDISNFQMKKMILIYYHCEEVEKYLMQYYEQTGFEYHKEE